jgi:hypothetical protein
MSLGVLRVIRVIELLELLVLLGLFIVMYHMYKTYNYVVMGKNYWVNLIHIFFVGPLLMYIGYYGEKTPRLYFEILLMFGFASMGYHSYYLFKDLVFSE